MFGIYAAFARVDFKQATLKIKDGGSEEITVKIGSGNLTYSETLNRDYQLDRGLLDAVRDGDDAPMEVRFDFIWDYIKGALGSGALPSIEDALKNIGNASAWVSTDSDTCNPFAVDLEFTYTPSPSTCGDKETITFPDFRYEKLDHDVNSASVACTGRCNSKTATVVRAVQP